MRKNIQFFLLFAEIAGHCIVVVIRHGQAIPAHQLSHLIQHLCRSLTVGHAGLCLTADTVYGNQCGKIRQHLLFFAVDECIDLLFVHLFSSLNRFFRAAASRQQTR